MPLFRRRARPAPLLQHPGLSAKDYALLAALRDAGVDLAHAREVNYYLYAPSAQAAITIAESARARPFHVDVREPLPEHPGQWAVVCTTHTALDVEFVGSTTQFFEQLAEEHGAEYDGWEAAI